MDFETGIATVQVLVHASATTPADRPRELKEALTQLQEMGERPHGDAVKKRLRALEDEAVGRLCELAMDQSPAVHDPAEAVLGNWYVWAWLDKCSQRQGFVPPGIDADTLGKALYQSVVMFLEALTGRVKPLTGKEVRTRRRRSPGWRRQPTFDIGRPVKPYVRTVLKNCLRDCVRSARQVAVGSRFAGLTMAAIRPHLARKHGEGLFTAAWRPKIRIPILLAPVRDGLTPRNRYRWELLKEGHVLGADECVRFFLIDCQHAAFGGPAPRPPDSDDGQARALRERLRKLMAVCSRCLPSLPPDSQAVLEALMTRKMKEVVDELSARRTSNENNPYLIISRARTVLRAAMRQECAPQDRPAVTPFVKLFFGKHGANRWARMEDDHQ